MIWEGNIRKMPTERGIEGREVVDYQWLGKDVLEFMPPQNVHHWIGKEVQILFEGRIHCVVSGKPIRKTDGEGMSYDAWRSSPQAVESVIRPELSRIHEGIALRNAAWEEAHHNQPHVVYLSVTSGLKVGVTRLTNVPYRWHDQGAVSAIIIAQTPYRQLAGLIEVALKPHLADRTNYRQMLTDVPSGLEALESHREQAFDWLGELYEPFFDETSPPESFSFPVVHFPSKIKSIRLEKEGRIEGRLAGIKGQYFIFEDGRVINIRNHAGYRVSIKVDGVN